MLRVAASGLALTLLAPVCLFSGVWIGFFTLEALYLWAGLDLPTEVTLLVLLLPGLFSFWAIGRWMLRNATANY